MFFSESNRANVHIPWEEKEEKEKEEEKGGLFKADAANEEDPERRRMRSIAGYRAPW